MDDVAVAVEVKGAGEPRRVSLACATCRKRYVISLVFVDDLQLTPSLLAEKSEYDYRLRTSPTTTDSPLSSAVRREATELYQLCPPRSRALLVQPRHGVRRSPPFRPLPKQADASSAHSEENSAVKERKHIAKLRKLTGVDSGKTLHRKTKSSSPLIKNEYVDDEGGSVGSPDGYVHGSREAEDSNPLETALSTRRRWIHTLPLHAVATTNSLLLTAATPASGERRGLLTPGLSSATSNFHISGQEPRTAPASSTTQTSYFLPQVQSAVSPPSAQLDPWTTAQQPQLLPIPVPVPISSPKHRCSSLKSSPLRPSVPFLAPSATEYPLTPPYEPVYLSPCAAPVALALEIEEQQWYDAAPPPRAPRAPLAQHQSVPHLVQHAPTASWSLFNAIPSPDQPDVRATAVTAQPPTTSYSTSPSFPPHAAPPLIPIPLAPKPYHHRSSLQQTLTPASSYDATSSLGLQLLHPTENAPLPVRYDSSAPSWTSSRYSSTSVLPTQPHHHNAVKDALEPWTESWVEEQGRQYVEPHHGSPVW